MANYLTDQVRTLARTRDLTLLDSDQREVVSDLLRNTDPDPDLAMDIIVTLGNLPTIYERVFEKAADLIAQAQYRNTNLGRMVHVTHDRAEYTVIVPADFRAHIAYRRAWGGIDDLHVNATAAQDRRLRK